jgi:hypothetical protein
MAKKEDTVSTEKMIDACQRRTHERSKGFLYLTPEELIKYDQLAASLVRWIAASKYSYRDVSCFSKNKIGIARIYHEFKSDPNAEEVKVEVNDFTATPEEILDRPELYHTVITLAKAGHKVCVILRGLPGCGKTSIADRILENTTCTVSRHCTDNFFMVNHEYVYDPSMLKEYHERNYQAFASSDAQVKINENTNICSWEFARYLAHARNNGYINIVLECKTAPLHELVIRNSHDVPENSLKKMLRKYKTIAPSYYGVFVRPFGAGETIDTPLHITCRFIGCNKKKEKNAVDLYPSIGIKTLVRVIGTSVSVAGRASVVECLFPVEAETPHITLGVFCEYSPVDVGRLITLKNTVTCEPFDLPGVFAPMY